MPYIRKYVRVVPAFTIGFLYFYKMSAEAVLHTCSSHTKFLCQKAITYSSHQIWQPVCIDSPSTYNTIWEFLMATWELCSRWFFNLSTYFECEWGWLLVIGSLKAISMGKWGCLPNINFYGECPVTSSKWLDIIVTFSLSFNVSNMLNRVQ